MKKVDHFFENNIYLIKNFAVARNPLFKNSYYRKRFLEKMDLYLSPLCQILHYVIDIDQYQIVIKVAGRETFLKYYKTKIEAQDIPHALIPPSTHILSQVISNLQSSSAIHLNRKEGRKGSLFAQRFKKELVENKEELVHIITQLHNNKQVFRHSSYWRYKTIRKNKAKNIVRTSLSYGLNARAYYANVLKQHDVLNKFTRIGDLDLHGQFNNLPPSSIYHTDWTKESLSKSYFIIYPP